MGFGLLFIGYFIAFLMSVNNYGFAFQIVGYAIMFSAIGKLSEYKHKLSATTVPLFLLSLCALYDAGNLLASLTNLRLALFSEENQFWVSIFAIVISTVFQVLLLSGIREIGRDADAEGIPVRAVWSILVVCLVGVWKLVLSLMSTLPDIDTSKAFRLLTLGAALVSLLYPVVILAFLFSCYAKICAPEDTEMEARPSRFAFVNRWREEREKKADEVRKLREDYQKQLEAKANGKSNESKSKNKKK